LEGDIRIASALVQSRVHTIVRDGRSLRVEPKVMEVLLCLARHAGEVVSREQLIAEVWAGTFVTDHVLTRSIAELRKAFDDDVREPRIIQTIAKGGYRLIAPVEPASDGAPAALQRETARESRPRPRLIVPALLVAAGVIAGALAMFLALRPGTRPDAPQVLRAVLPLGEPLRDLRPARSIAMSSDGSRIAYVAIRDGKTLLFLRALEGGDATPVSGTDGAVLPFFSPDGRWIGFWADGKLKKASTSSLAVVPICDAPGDYEGAIWAPDGFCGLFLRRSPLSRTGRQRRSPADRRSGFEWRGTRGSSLRRGRARHAVRWAARESWNCRCVAHE